MVQPSLLNLRNQLRPTNQIISPDVTPKENKKTKERTTKEKFWFATLCSTGGLMTTKKKSRKLATLSGLGRGWR